MFILPLLILPFLWAAAVNRLIAVPRRYLADDLQLAHAPASFMSMLTGCAYLWLLVTLWVWLFGPFVC